MATGDSEFEVLGSQVSLQRHDKSVSGEVFGGDFKEDGSVLVLRQPGSTRFHSKIVIVKYQDAAEVMNYERYRSHSLDRLPAVDIARCRLREQHAVQAAEVDAARINVDATEEGQAIFDALSKTLPCRWEQKTIIVLDEVYIEEPYNLESCRSVYADDVATLEHVKKVLVAENAKLHG